ncbi:hypothetical protein CEXT_691781 [Caerostris extrusa]|uniref:Uncharacterized protein n=1 Tax=Caerostris extrusa TaxID=172846 RepID=A0AAV4M5D4_CAEEX|nr:hypothetical protein CEXT_691781 [Caerostris extrusa]
MEHQLIEQVFTDPIRDLAGFFKRWYECFKHGIMTYIFVVIARAFLEYYSWYSYHGVVFTLSAYYLVNIMGFRKILISLYVIVSMYFLNIYSCTVVWFVISIVINIPNLLKKRQ